MDIADIDRHAFCKSVGDNPVEPLLAKIVPLIIHMSNNVYYNSIMTPRPTVGRGFRIV